MRKSLVSVCAIAALSSFAGAETIEIEFENLLPSGGTAFTPVFFGLHDGGFDLFSSGETASSALEQVAELGATGDLEALFGGSAGTGAFGTTSGGPITGGNSTSLSLDVLDPTSERFLTFASMVVPTNDLFIGNGNQLAYELFDAAGNFNGPVTIEIFGSNVYDAGTEVNNADDGAAFLQGIDGTAGTAQNGTVQLFFSDPNSGDYLDSLLGRTTAPGFDIESTFGSATPIARITVVPTPGALAGLAVCGLMVRRRRRA
ncbi:MAG: spondin domain-containing protein [Planctomycetota bacterium]